jgi:hypothetical protein
VRWQRRKELLRGSVWGLLRLVFWATSGKMFAQAVQQAPVALRGEGADRAKQSGFWQDRKKTKADERRRLQAARSVVVVANMNCVVKAFDGVMQLGADTAHQPVVKRRHLAEDNHRPALSLAIDLWQNGQGDIALNHRCLTSLSEYSGSFSPYARARLAADVCDQSSRSSSVMGSTVTIRRVLGGKSNGSSSRIVSPS